ncbi:flagellar hook-length control protein FliK [Bacillus sp. RAR_GA_16]|uniref:flagellar hook-length control protein FliK n=1 Tax=Bacillus sp. RAR_GA_16 TaxID=2876774 RepID=UPI001CCD1333|nr:flagellar hook-length control protein FliK [Bacillus sp. RAR_GA_16]MCA0170568.1 flagellar hook-length control protein FliK [Bacillus sp. RAR_GA_16]
MNAIQSLGKSVIIQPKSTDSNSTGFSTLLTALGIKMTEAAGSSEGTEGKSELEQGDEKTPFSESELPLDLLAALPLTVQGQSSSSPKLQLGLESSRTLQMKGEGQQGGILTGFTKQELMDLEQFGKPISHEQQAPKLPLSNELSVQLQKISGFHNGEEMLPGFLKREWLKQQGAKEVLASPLSEANPIEEVKVVEVSKGQEAKTSLEMMKQMTAEPTSQQKNLYGTVEQNTPLEEKEAIVEDGEQRPALKEGEVGKSQVDQTEGTEQLENLDQTSTESLILDDVQSDEKPEGLPLIKQSNEAPVKEATVQARYLNSELSEMITERMQLSKNGDETNIRIKLSPENLGQLDIRLTTLDGKVTAHIVTATAGAKELIESQLHQLRHTLVQQGIQLDKIEVVQQPQGSQQPFMQDGRGDQGQQFQQGKQRQGRKGEYELEDNPLVTSEKEESTLGGINYAI